MKYLIIKLSDKRDGRLDPPNIYDDKALRERACGDWTTSLPTLYNTNHCLVLYKKLILREYILSDEITLVREKNRIRFHILKEIKDSKYVKRMLDYRSSNPLSVLDSSQFKYIQN